MAGTLYSLELRPSLPPRLARLTELAGNLVYSWDRDIRGLFWRLDRQLWIACGNNPKIFLRRIPQATLDAAARDRDFIEDYDRAVSAFDSYHSGGARPEVLQYLDPAVDLVAYFCAEYGLHESFPIYSGGLGILAGDHCKAASDLSLPFVAVGLLYRQGYFTQRIDGHGRQQALYGSVDFQDLPIDICCAADGTELRVSVMVAERQVFLRIWKAQVGNIRLFLLDSDLAENTEDDRGITYQLYGGNTDTRIQQEIVLGVGGVRALRALGLAPSAWHINEGHAAFQILERMREQVAAGLSFEAALESVAAATVFTTHTPVPAGHDIFHHAQLAHFLSDLRRGLGVAEETLFALGADPHGAQRFNMTALALRGSRFHNGVSRIHGEVASRMESYIWPQIPPDENPIRHVTNGVHMGTFIARAWTQLFHDQFRDWRNQSRNPGYWHRIEEIPEHRFVSIRQQLKSDLLVDLSERLRRQHRRNGVSEATIARAVRYVSDVGTRTLVVGFARRFATYKRATLLLKDPERLAAILNNPKRPAIVIFAGKAHPKDQPGQDLIRTLYEYSMKPEFIGRLIVVEGYDMLLARNLVQGCDVWLNNPEYPLEASGTSGEKAGINGVVNLSVLDGWWGEGYNGHNGFAVTPVEGHVDPEARNAEEGRQLLDIFEHQVVPLYYGRSNHGYAPEWIRLSKNSMSSLIPRFNSQRMVMDYVADFYASAVAHGRKLANGAASELADWKRRVRERWNGVSLQLVQAPAAMLSQGERLPLRASVQLNGLSPGDVIVECVLGRLDSEGRLQPERRIAFALEGDGDHGTHRYALDLDPSPGLQHYKLRMVPFHALLAHPFETGCMVWA